MKIVAIDINLEKVKSTKTAYVRLPSDIANVFRRCMEEHHIVGFEWDSEEGPLNFGVILKDKTNDGQDGDGQASDGQRPNAELQG